MSTLLKARTVEVVMKTTIMPEVRVLRREDLTPAEGLREDGG
jgi:hypothetical protein